MAKYYAVKNGRKVGIFETWNECEQQVKGYPKANYKSFQTKEEAEEYLGIQKRQVLNPQKEKQVLPIKEEAIEEKKIINKVNENLKNTHHTRLTDSQKEAYECMMDGENVFLTGEAGTGKSFVINKFIKEKELENKNILVCAPTGIAAINIGGVTIHRCFQAPIEPQINKRISKVPNAVQEADIIIIDEISMCRIDLFDYVARVIIKAEEKCLKRKQVIVVGDFFQLPPVTIKEDYEVLKEIYPNYNKGFAFESSNWKDFDFKMIVLKDVVRQSDTMFIKELNKIRIGDKRSVEFFNRNASQTKIENGIVLCATNAVADKINQEELKKIKKRTKIFKAKVTGDVKATDKPTSDEVKLKVGARVIVLINDTVKSQYQNGSLGDVIEIREDSVDVLLDQNQSIVTFGMHEWIVENYTLTQEHIEGVNYQKLKKKKVGSFIQIPLKLAYAITIHKSQGQTYDKVNLIPYSFDCGQLYVALSRVKSLEGLCLINRMRQEDLICNDHVKKFYNIIDQEEIERRKNVLVSFAKKVITLEPSIQAQLPEQLKQMITNVKSELQSH